MEKNNAMVVPATTELVRAFLGRDLEWTSRSICCMRDDKVIGIGGVYLRESVGIAYSTISETMRHDRRAVVKAVRAFRKLLNEFRTPVYAMAGEFDTAEGFLEHVGFQQVTGRIYQWPT
jgi:hypothetical protein